MGAKPKIKKIGGSFPTFSFSLREDNARVSPTYFEWHDGLVGDQGKIFVFADKLRFWAAAYHDVEDCVAILTEPRGLHPEDYEFAREHHDQFHKVLTYDRQLLEAIPNGLFYPLGGSSIAFEDWGIYPKTKDVCMIVSEKNTMPGHKLRHEIVKQFEGKIDFYGAGVGKPFKHKFDVLKDYKYCVVVESENREDYFTEKLIDAMSVLCFPLIWGSQGDWIKKYFVSVSFFRIRGIRLVFEKQI